MISSHHKAIFVHIPKCAGKSIERAFLKDLGLDWKVDWQEKHSLLLRPKRHNELGPERLAHLYAYEYVKFGYIDEVKFREFFKFSVVRDPIDRIVSELNYQEVSKDLFRINSVEEYIVKTYREYGIDSDIVRHLEPQVNFLFDEKMKNIIVDKVIWINDIESEFQSLKNQVVFNDLELELKKENVSQSKKWLRSDLAQSDIDFLKEFYDLDYKFLANYCLGK